MSLVHAFLHLFSYYRDFLFTTMHRYLMSLILLAQSYYTDSLHATIWHLFLTFLAFSVMLWRLAKLYGTTLPQEVTVYLGILFTLVFLAFAVAVLFLYS